MATALVGTRTALQEDWRQDVSVGLYPEKKTARREDV